MAKFFDELTPKLQSFIAEQKIFFTASAPDQGRLNLSPKGMDCFRCLDSKRVAYLDLTGSGNETAAHLMENGRMTIMFCSFSDKPLILRLYGQGSVVTIHDPRWESVSSAFKLIPGARQVVEMRIDNLQTSCGFGVPTAPMGLMERTQLVDWAEKKGDGLNDYRTKNNSLSIDGLPSSFPKSDA